ncbi:MAG: hypothetical protein SFY69_09475 [Planctomycetota bacterium]|nr:hypothetical protein [Planctomycetota bacterium]
MPHDLDPTRPVPALRLLAVADHPVIAARVAGDAPTDGQGVLLRDGWWDALEHIPRAGTVIVRTTPGIDDGPAWLPGARGAMAERLDALEARVTDGVLVVLPHAEGVISDVPSTRTMLRARERWWLLLDPLALLTPAMLADAPDHLSRVFDALGEHERLWGLVLPGPGPWREAVGARIEHARRERADAGRGVLVLERSP